MKAALYARFSTDKQRPESIEDQHRTCERFAERHGFTVVARFSDAAISGGTAQRPGYQRMLAAARRHEFDVIVSEDTSRLWRNLAEQSPRLAELADLGIAVVTHDLDTRHESAEIMGAVGGAMASAYRKEIGRRTRRGLEGRARAGKSAGGRSYGYLPPALSGTGQIEVDPAQAAVVLRIFRLFADGHSPRMIADALNRDGVQSPGASWGREVRRRRGWVHTAIQGDPARGIGLLNNSLYCGLVVWNRSRWIRSAADSSKRRQVQNPRKDWITRQEERLRIVPQELWDRVKARQADQAHRVGERVKSGMSKATAIRTGAGPKYLISGLLKCSHCGSSYAIAGRDIYRCSGHTSGGSALCTNDALVRRGDAEAAIVNGIKRDLSRPEVIEDLCRRVRSAMRQAKRSNAAAPDHSARIARLRAEIDNLVDAIAGGALRASPTIAARLADAESEVDRLTREQEAVPARQTADVTELLAGLTARAARAIERLEVTLASGDIAAAREELRAHVGTVSVEADDREVRLYSEHGVAAALLRAGASPNASLFGSGGRI